MGGKAAVFDLFPEPPAELTDLLDGAKDRLKFGGRLMMNARTDVADEKGLAHSFQEALGFLGKFDGCVTAAGINFDKPFLDHTWAETEKLLAINTLGTFFTVQHTVRHLRSQSRGGNIVLIGSVKAHCAAPGHHLSGYTASKGAIRALCMDLAVELAPHNIRVNTISPG
ncbi:MAG: hypothetical protein Q9227_001079 [Pyrenula ochraceoflavens]